MVVGVEGSPVFLAWGYTHIIYLQTLSTPPGNTAHKYAALILLIGRVIFKAN